jgi:predicted hotdog family 3-hydroxylacyl-ACP dehydratase
MVLLDALTAWAPGRAECAMVVREQAPFVTGGVLHVPATLEHMAQAVAACLGYEAFRGGAGVRVGMIIACKRFEAHRPTLAVGDALRIRAERIRGNDTLSHFACEVRRVDPRDDAVEEPIATATLTLFHGERPPA